MTQKIGSLLALIAGALILGYAIGWLFPGNTITDGIATALKTLGWLIFWGVTLIVRTVGEIIAALAQAAMNFFQGQAPWLPNIPPIF